MKKMILNTESYLSKGTKAERFFPFFELEYNEWVIYENDSPKYFLYLSQQSKSDFVNGIVAQIESGIDLRKIIIDLGSKFEKNWDIFSSNLGNEIKDSYKSEKIELKSLSDYVINGF
jgi:hypothetical protein